MSEQESAGLKVLDCRAQDHEYLHKDFHGVLCYSIKYLDDNFGPEATEQYLRRVGRNVYGPLIAALHAEGLDALERHWRDIFTREGGGFTLRREDGALVLEVSECPAVCHLKKTGQLYTERYCESTVVVNDTICGEAGYKASCRYEPGQGKCVQKFWKGEEEP